MDETSLCPACHIAVRYTVNLVNTINSQVEKQLQGIEGF